LSGAPAVAPGLLIAERYRLDAAIPDRSAAAVPGRSASKVGQLWHAHDELLARSVAVLLVPDDDPLLDAVLAGARAIAGLGHPALANVYDAARAPGLAFVVTEYFDGESLDHQLRNGPLEPAAAIDLVAEIAAALSATHAIGVYGLTPAPSRILFTASGLPRLASVALADDSRAADDPRRIADARADTVALAQLLYAALTARWPGESSTSALPAAPYTEGHLCTPRQVRGGVPRELDVLVSRALGDDEVRRGLPEIATPAALFSALAPLRSLPDAGHPFGADTAIIPLVDPRGRTALITRQAAPLLGRRRRFRLGVAAGLTVLAVAIAALFWRGPTIYPHFITHPGGSTPTPTQTTNAAAGRAVVPRSIAEFDPYGDHTDPHVGEAPLAIDGNAATAWHTQTFGSPALGNLKPGVGLLVDLGEARQISAVQLVLLGDGTTVSLLTGDGDQPPTSEKAMSQVAQAVDAESHVTLRLAQPHQARYWLVWLTKLPKASGGYHGGIAELTFQSGS
jgi:eukaryotic-like serine/threonine-protein kinase